MAWDLAQNLQTGDLVWDAKRDLHYADGLGLIQQRIHRRLMIERGDFVFDRTGNLGSRLYSLLNMGIPSASAGIEMIIREALNPMDDINVTDITIHYYGDGTNVVLSPSSVLAKITYQLNTAIGGVIVDTLGQFQTDVVLPA